MSEEMMNQEDFAKAIDASFDTFKDEDQMAWEKLQEYIEEKTVLNLTVEGIASKGVIAVVEGVRGFIPASHLSLTRVEDLNEYLGKEIQVLVREIDPEKNRLILSCRELLQEKARVDRRKQIESIPVGTVFQGVVESLQTYGAFVRLENGVSGLVHVSQISHSRIKSPKQVLSEGDEVTVKVIDIKDGKLSLSIKALLEDPSSVEEEPELDVELPESEAISTSLGDLLKNLKL